MALIYPFVSLVLLFASLLGLFFSKFEIMTPLQLAEQQKREARAARFAMETAAAAAAAEKPAPMTAAAAAPSKAAPVVAEPAAPATAPAVQTSTVEVNYLDSLLLLYLIYCRRFTSHLLL